MMRYGTNPLIILINNEGYTIEVSAAAEACCHGRRRCRPGPTTGQPAGAHSAFRNLFMSAAATAQPATAGMAQFVEVGGRGAVLQDQAALTRVLHDMHDMCRWRSTTAPTTASRTGTTWAWRGRCTTERAACLPRG